MRNTATLFQALFTHIYRKNLILYRPNLSCRTNQIKLFQAPGPGVFFPAGSVRFIATTSTEENRTIRMPKKRKADDEASDGSKQAKTEGTEANKMPDDANTLDPNTDKKSASGEKWNFKISSWNVNGLRAWEKKDGLKYLTLDGPDILCLQETKCDEKSIPGSCTIDGYHNYWYAAEQAGYAGTGIMSKVKPLNVTYGIGCEQHDKEGRVITAEYDKFYLVTSYVPNAGKKLVRLAYREEWDKDFRNYLVDLDKKKPVILCGDLNVAHNEIDLANPKSNRNKTAGFTDQERQGFTDLLAAGFIDSYRHFYPQKTAEYSFWTYMMNARAKNTGWRLDYFVVSEKLKPNICDSVIRTKCPSLTCIKDH
ncbi:DNA-(apurinic or apyrimidinic site) lyase-like isoform X2 [Anneissia japonica]|uniref:DNA-(apurinic or apyrimidinic site) lyase-like isoform X2 n=1 Tax=Anneissia japonica TaxID=1529436 RepID=UPI001425767E|nr:DNA-(apurinic or apyrimidinic site) lyase-like isoform X2 [Anneissia japonica]